MNMNFYLEVFMLLIQFLLMGGGPNSGLIPAGIDHHGISSRNQIDLNKIKSMLDLNLKSSEF